jgi:hypothetical protein
VYCTFENSLHVQYVYLRMTEQAKVVINNSSVLI